MGFFNKLINAVDSVAGLLGDNKDYVPYSEEDIRMPVTSQNDIRYYDPLENQSYFFIDARKIKFETFDFSKDDAEYEKYFIDRRHNVTCEVNRIRYTDNSKKMQRANFEVPDGYEFSFNISKTNVELEKSSEVRTSNKFKGEKLDKQYTKAPLYENRLHSTELVVYSKETSDAFVKLLQYHGIYVNDNTSELPKYKKDLSQSLNSLFGKDDVEEMYDEQSKIYLEYKSYEIPEGEIEDTKAVFNDPLGNKITFEFIDDKLQVTEPDYVSPNTVDCGRLELDSKYHIKAEIVKFSYLKSSRLAKMAPNGQEEVYRIFLKTYNHKQDKYTYHIDDYELITECEQIPFYEGRLDDRTTLVYKPEDAYALVKFLRANGVEVEFDPSLSFMGSDFTEHLDRFMDDYFDALDAGFVDKQGNYIGPE